METIIIKKINSLESCIGGKKLRAYVGNICVVSEENPRDVYFLFDASGNSVSVKDMKGRVIYKFIDTKINVKDIIDGQTINTECYSYELNGREDVYTFLEVEG